MGKIASAVMGALALGMTTMIAASAMADPIEILSVQASKASDGSWRFSVKLNHADTGWDHYANRWKVLSSDGLIVFAERILAHPHVNEMPFTRAQSGIRLPQDTDQVLIRAFDNGNEEAQGELLWDMPDR